MNVIRSLKASAEAFGIVGEATAAAECERIIRECRIADALFGDGASNSLSHANIAASHFAARAALKLQEFQHGRKVA